MDAGGFLLLTVLSLAAVCDCHSRRVPNRLLLIGWMAGLLFYPEPGYVYRWLLPVLLLFPLFCCRMMGAGDLKLYGLVCSVCGVAGWFRCFTYSIFLGALLALIKMAYYRNFRERFSYFWFYILETFHTKAIRPYCQEGRDRTASIPLSVPILLAWLLMLLQNAL